METAPDYLVIGHVAKDLLLNGGGQRAGGTATYSALTAQRLGLQAAIVTAIAPEDEALLSEVREAGVWVHAVPSEKTTTFSNIYDTEGRRDQIISGQANTIQWGDLPVAWRGAGIVHLGPIAQEVPADMPSRFPYCLLGITPQGWMRSWDEDGRVRHSAVPVPPGLEHLPPNAFLVLSIEDLGYKQDLIDCYIKLAPLVAITDAAGDALLHSGNGRRKVAIRAFPADTIDPTGAGDVFATALLVRYRETADPVESARFAHATAACAIEREGTDGIPDRDRVLERMRSDT